jgi:hypothetical protein
LSTTANTLIREPPATERTVEVQPTKLAWVVEARAEHSRTAGTAIFMARVLVLGKGTEGTGERVGTRDTAGRESPADNYDAIPITKPSFTSSAFD